MRHPWQASFPVAHWSISDSCLGKAISAVLWLQMPCLQQAREYIKHCGEIVGSICSLQNSRIQCLWYHSGILCHSATLAFSEAEHSLFVSQPLQRGRRQETRGLWGDGGSQVLWHWAQPATHPLQWILMSIHSLVVLETETMTP